jgi:hypothetical protein
LPITTGFLGLDHDLERVVAMLGRDDRPRIALNAFDHVAQPIGPGPVWVGLAIELPGPDLVLPQLVALGIPVVAQHLDRSGAAIDLDRRAAILLHRKAGRDDRYMVQEY